MTRLKKKIKREEHEYSLGQTIIEFLGAPYQTLLEKMHRHHAKGFHMSSMITMPEGNPRFCLRRIEIERRFADKLERGYHHGGLQFVFDVGTQYHHLIQTYLSLLGDNKTQGLYGRWKCIKCRHTWYAFCIQPCSKCKASIKYVQYREYPFYNKRYDILSTTDGLWWRKHKGEWYEDIIEIKSIKDNANYAGDHGFQELMGPLDHHSYQAQMYFFLRRWEIEHKKLKRPLPEGFDAWPKPGKVRILYVNKNNQFQGFKEYAFVPPDKRIWKLVIGRISKIWEHELEKKYAPKVCKTIKDGKKIDCPVRDICFGKLNKK